MEVPAAAALEEEEVMAAAAEAAAAATVVVSSGDSMLIQAVRSARESPQDHEFILHVIGPVSSAAKPLSSAMLIHMSMHISMHMSILMSVNPIGRPSLLSP